MKLHAYFIFPYDDNTGWIYLAESVKEAKRLAWGHVEIDDYILMRIRKQKTPVPKELIKKGELHDEALGYCLGWYSFFEGDIDCPLCKKEKAYVDSETEELRCRECQKEITLEDCLAKYREMN